MVNRRKAIYQSVEEVPVWMLAHKLALLIYKITKIFPRDELYGLISQLRRAALSIPANIAEGFYRNTTKELIQFLYTSRGSYGEVMYYLRFAYDLGYLNLESYENIKDEYTKLGKQLNGWIKSLKKNI